MEKKCTILAGKNLDMTKLDSLADCFFDKADQSEQSIICIDEEGREYAMTYGQLRSAAVTAAANLQNRGIKKGDRVCILVRRTDVFLKLLWGVIICGASAIPISAMEKLYLKRAEEVIETARPEIIISEKNEQIEGKSCVSADLLLTEQGAVYERVEKEKKDVPLILFTSGSTGKSKGVKLSNRSILGTVLGTVQERKLNAEDIFLNWLSLDHCQALIHFHIQAFYLGAKQIQVNTEYILKEPYRWMELLSKYRSTITWAPNFAYALAGQVEEKLIQNVNLSSLRYLLSASESVNAKTCLEFEEKWSRYGLARGILHSAWGMTETGGVVAIISQKKENMKEGEYVSSGIPIPGMKLKIEAGEGEKGELFVCGDALMEGYLGENPVGDQWFPTGDLAIIRNGELYVIDRKKDILIVNGKNISVIELEERVKAELKEKELNVYFSFAWKPELGREAIAVFAAAPFANIEEKENLCKKISMILFSDYGFGYDYIAFLSDRDVPRTEVGKVKRKEMMQQLQAGMIQPFMRSPLLQKREKLISRNQVQVQDAEKKILEIWRKNLQLDELSAEDNFFLSGGNSAKIPKILTEMEQALSCKVSTADLLMAPTVRELLEKISPKQAKEEEEIDDRIELIDI